VHYVHYAYYDTPHTMHILCTYYAHTMHILCVTYYAPHTIHYTLIHYAPHPIHYTLYTNKYYTLLVPPLAVELEGLTIALEMFVFQVSLCVLNHLDLVCTYCTRVSLIQHMCPPYLVYCTRATHTTCVSIGRLLLRFRAQFQMGRVGTRTASTAGRAHGQVWARGAC
jgi:hypothetical protein